MRPWEVGRLTPRQAAEIYLCRRDRRTGAPLIDDDLPDEGPPMSDFELFRYHCHMTGVTRPTAVGRLWRERLREADAAARRAPLDADDGEGL